jgi:hypothetical protein
MLQYMVIKLLGYIISIERVSSWVGVGQGIAGKDKSLGRVISSIFAGNKRIPAQGITIHTDETEYYRSINSKDTKIKDPYTS